DPVWAHSQGVADQVPDADLALALDVWRPRLQPDDVRLLEAELGCVLDGDDALILWQERAKHVQAGGLPGAGSARDQDVDPTEDAALEELHGGFGDRAERDEVLGNVGVGGELPDGEGRPIDGERRDD